MADAGLVVGGEFTGFAGVEGGELLLDLAVEQHLVLLDGEGLRLEGDLDGLADPLFLQSPLELIDERMAHNILDGDALPGVHLENPLQQVHQLPVLAGEQVREAFLFCDRHRLNNGPRGLTFDEAHLLPGGFSSNFENLLQLRDGGGALKERLAQEDLSQHTPQTPDIDFLAVAVGAEEDFGGPVPPGGDVFGEEDPGVALAGNEGPYESEIADLDLANLVHKYIGRLKIAVNEVGGVQVVDGVGNLIEDEVLVNLLEDAVADGGGEVGFHELQRDVDISGTLGSVVGYNLDDVGVRQFLQVLDLAVGALRVGGVTERIIYLF